jgi:Na+-driven multidrug efflux pump
VFVLRKPFISLYGAAEDISTLASTLVAIAAVTLLGTTYHAACFRGINRGAGDGNFVVLIDLICGWLIVLPLTFLAAFVFKAPLPVIFLFTRIDQCFKWLIAFLRLKGSKWIRNVTRSSAEAA